jgi:diguanylate cyclase (GGDEF)-like protein
MIDVAAMSTEELRALVAQLSTDKVTGLTTRTAWETRAVDFSGFVGAVMIDLDGLKAANDTFGHAAGESLLAQAGRIARLVTRVTDSSAIRWGGDEILLVFPDTSDIGPIVARLAMLFDGRYGVSASVGGAASRVLSDAISQADESMYAAKRARRQQAVSC